MKGRNLGAPVMALIRMAQFGTGHSHAFGRLQVMRRNANVEMVGVYEPDPKQRAALEASDGPYRDVHWFHDQFELLDDPTIVAVATEGRNIESLDHTEAIVKAGKHVWYDKPAGENWKQWKSVVNLAKTTHLIIQVGYMFRYHDGFQQIANWVESGLLGRVFGMRAHMSTWFPKERRERMSCHAGGIFYDLAGHMIDQMVWLLGRPVNVTSFLRNDSDITPEYKDNTLGIFEYEQAIVMIDISALETMPVARRFEVYGSGGSVIMEPFEPARMIRLCLNHAHNGYQQGEQTIPVTGVDRETLYARDLEAFLASITGKCLSPRSLDHELVVQETLLRATGRVRDEG